jgi:hypothetical protein
MEKKENETLELIVERYTFKTWSSEKTHMEALFRAASLAEGLLYCSIYGAIELDLIKGWGREGPNYPKPETRHDNVAEWKSNWIIPPYEYFKGIRWKPFDKMQQFEINVEAVKKGDQYEGRVHMVAYVWNDNSNVAGGGERTGCLLDVVDRNRGQILLAETGKIIIPMDKNKKEGINDANLGRYGERWDVFGFLFPPDEIGDIGHRPIEFKPIDLDERHQECMYRDR